MVKRRAYTLVEVMMYTVIFLTLASIATFQFGHQVQVNRESQLRAELRQVRDAMERAYADTGWYPQPADLASATPKSGYRPVGGQPMLGGGWTYTSQVPINKWQGPYLDHKPVDPTTGGDFCYNSGWAGAGNAVYSCTTAYNTW